MSLFRRNQTDQTGMPPEIQSYYQEEGQQRSWTAWLLALATLFVTIVVVLGIFFGGRWTFRKLKNTDKPTVATVQNEESKDKDASSNPSSDSPSSQPTPSNLPEPTRTNPAAPTPSTTPAPSTQTQTPNSNLPATGPGDIAAVFVLTSIIGTIFYDRVLRTRGSNS